LRGGISIRIEADGENMGIQSAFRFMDFLRSASEAYADERMNEPASLLPSDKTFSTWYCEREPSLRHDALQRDKNLCIAQRLLPLFEEKPGHWEAIAFLNIGGQTSDKPFARYLADWQSNCDSQTAYSLTKLRPHLVSNRSFVNSPQGIKPNTKSLL